MPERSDLAKCSLDSAMGCVPHTLHPYCQAALAPTGCDLPPKFGVHVVEHAPMDFAFGSAQLRVIPGRANGAHVEHLGRAWCLLLVLFIRCLDSEISRWEIAHGTPARLPTGGVQGMQRASPSLPSLPSSPGAPDGCRVGCADFFQVGVGPPGGMLAHVIAP